MNLRSKLRCIVGLAAAAALAGCGSLIPQGSPGGAGSGSARSGTSSAPVVAPRGNGRLSNAPQSIAPRPEDAACLADLGQMGARFEALPDVINSPGCNQLGTVRLAALAGDDTQFGITNLGPVQCPVAKAFNAWARFGVDRAARELLGSPLARIETMGSYACRTIAGSSRLSAHSRAAAIDVSGFVLQDGRRITLIEDWNSGTAAEREFLRVVHRSACRRFGTVLGPQYNRAHADHFHLENALMPGEVAFCR